MSSARSWQSLALKQFQKANTEFVAVLEALEGPQLGARGRGNVNSIGWTAWHLSRGMDRNLSEIAGDPQLWTAAGWAEKFGRPADPADTGFGHSASEAASFAPPSTAALLAYHEAVQRRAATYLRSAPGADAARLVTSPTLGNVHTVEERLVALLADTFLHLGQISMLRQLVGGEVEIR
ncbi:DinB family protein [Streptomyces sp. NBC_01537]|uniref:DinB family protein n=1 Tax=Streptomyces sp. NBC_01537 TaxID=2903896 RepID=UPI003869666E